MIHSDSLSRLWKRVGNKMTADTSVPVYVEPVSAPMGDRMRRVLETGCSAMGSYGPTDAPCAVAVMYGSMPNQMYYYTNKMAYQFADMKVTDMTYNMQRDYEGFYMHMMDTMDYSNVYTYSYDGTMDMKEMLRMMNASKYTGDYGESWYGDMINYGKMHGNAKYPYMSDGDMMMRIKMHV
tara:strand:- start:142 stop:681 length:540 start_codon:yes stop_codon:yes gene_type:complete